MSAVWPAANADRASVRPHPTAQDLHERALARPVRPHQGVDLPGSDRERRRAQRDDRAVALRDVACVEQELGADGRQRRVTPVVRGDTAGVPAPPTPLPPWFAWA